MRVLVTGYRGLIGSRVIRLLAAAGHEVLGFDLVDGDDVTDKVAVSRVVDGCDGVIHLAAFDPPPPVTSTDAERVVEVNAIGSQHVLEACLLWGVPRFVFASSVDVLGIFMGEGTPSRLPIDESYPAEPVSAYGIAKRAVERVAKLMASEGGLTTICLRPPGVSDDATMARFRAARAEDEAFEWSPFWEYGAWIHVDDAAAAFVAALTCPAPPGGHATVLVAADDSNSDRFTSRELAERLLPDVPWWGDLEYDLDPHRSLLSNAAAKDLLGWAPERRWRG